MAGLYREELRGTLGPARPLRFRDSTDSTNEDALRWARESPPAPDGACVVADEQLRGRGRWGRTWNSAPGKALMFSIVLRPHALPPERAGLLSSAMGIACAEAIAEVTSLTPSLKWPNDVNIRGRKVAGVLFETQLIGEQIRLIVAGVGVNTHWKLGEIPEEIRDRATSLAVESEHPPSRGQLLAVILRRFERLYGDVLEGTGVAALLNRADELSDLLGQTVEITWPGGTVARGVAGGLSPSGALWVEIEGRTEAVDIAEVTRIRSTE